jgi:hypothetical protein
MQSQKQGFQASDQLPISVVLCTVVLRLHAVHWLLLAN